MITISQKTSKKGVSLVIRKYVAFFKGFAEEPLTSMISFGAVGERDARQFRGESRKERPERLARQTPQPSLERGSCYWRLCAANFSGFL